MSRSSSLINRTQSDGQSRRARSPAHLSLTAASLLPGPSADWQWAARQQIAAIPAAHKARRCRTLMAIVTFSSKIVSPGTSNDGYPPCQAVPSSQGPCQWDLEKAAGRRTTWGLSRFQNLDYLPSMSDIISLASTHTAHLANGSPHRPSAGRIVRSRHFPAIASQPVIHSHYHRAELMSDVLGAWPGHWPGTPFSSDGGNSDFSHLAGHPRGRPRVSGQTPGADQGTIKSPPLGPTFKPQHNP
jgi:hypothetical protein